LATGLQRKDLIGVKPHLCPHVVPQAFNDKAQDLFATSLKTTLMPVNI